MRFLLTVIVAASLSLGLICAPSKAQDAYFEIDALNVGLGETPDRVDRSTPRATMETLYRLSETGDWSAAAHVLNLGALPPGLQEEQGPVLAQQLVSVIDRKVVLDWSSLIDRPDALDVSETSNSATAGMARKSIRLWEFSTSPVPTSLYLQRVKPPDAEPVWVISRRSVSAIMPLYQEYGPTKFEQLLPSALRSNAFWGLMWWEFLGLPILLTLALFAGFVARKIVFFAKSRASGRLARKIIEASSTPLIIAAFTTVIWWATSTVFVFSGRINVFISPLVAIGFVTSLLMLILNTLEQVLDALVGFEEIDLTTKQEAEKREMATKVAALRRMLALIIFLVGTGIVLSSADVFEWLGVSILASAGALTLVIGFAARKVLGNIMASLQISLNQSAKVGDRVVYKDHLCHVERINFTYVQLRDWDGTRLIVPVEEFTNEVFENWTLKEPEMLRILKFKLAHDVDFDALRNAFDDVIASLDEEELDDLEKVKVVVTGQDIFGIDVWFYVPCADPNTSWDLACLARERLVLKLNKLAETSGKTIFPEAAAAQVA